MFDGLADGRPTAREASTVGGWMTAREVKPLRPTTGVKTVEEDCAAAEICPTLNGMADVSENGVPFARALEMMAAASEVGAFASAGVDSSTLTFAGTPKVGIVDKSEATTDAGMLNGDVSSSPGILRLELLRNLPNVAEVFMTTDAGTFGSDVSTGPGILKKGLLRISLSVAEVSGLEEKP